MWFVIPYYNKIFIFAVLERWLIYDYTTVKLSAALSIYKDDVGVAVVIKY